MEKQKTIFDFLNDITYHKIKWEDQSDSDKKRFQPYMLTRWLSMHPDYLEIVAEVQPVVSRMDSREFYNFFSDLLPRRKFFVKYVKSSAKETGNDQLIKFLSEKMMMSRVDVEDMIRFSSPDDIKAFFQQYGYSDKEIKKEFGI